jgi:cytoskeletal protein CcmA (bactofilin family)
MATRGVTEDPAGAPGKLSAVAGAETFSSGALDTPFAWTTAIERARLVIARGANVSGRLIFGEAVRIDGNFRGEVRSNDLVVVGDVGMVEGKVYAPRLVVMGELRGDVIGAERVMLAARARVTANIEAHQLVVAEGARFEGTVRRTSQRPAK